MLAITGEGASASYTVTGPTGPWTAGRRGGGGGATSLPRRNRCDGDASWTKRPVWLRGRTVSSSMCGGDGGFSLTQRPIWTLLLAPGGHHLDFNKS